MSLLVVLLVYHSIERYIKETYVKPFIKREIEPVAFKQGTLYLPDDIRDEFTSLLRYIKDNTKEGEKIYIGSLSHNVPRYGWFDLLYFLSERLPAVRHYFILPGFQSRQDIQEEMIESLKQNNTRLLLLRDYGDTATLGPLDKYIRTEYKLVTIIYSYHIYAKKR